jgi:O-methyltransferase involved in polyketide biosynthesis
MNISEIVDPALGGVAETLLIPLYHRAMESQRPDGILKDEKAAALVNLLNYDFDQIRRIRTTEGNMVARLMLTREMDRYAQEFLGHHPDGVVVHIGCGLDSRFERVDNGQVETWIYQRSLAYGGNSLAVKESATMCWIAQCSMIPGWTC